MKIILYPAATANSALHRKGKYMENERIIRFLRAEEIECRVSTLSEKGISLLLYKDARVDQNILDETFGIFGWMRTHERIGEALFCTVSIKGEDGMWVSKMDVGTESYADPVKGASSDAFKRACVNWGIGRELYSAPFIWISADKVNIQREKDKLVVKERFHVSRIVYDEERAVITGVEIQNNRNDVVYSYGLGYTARPAAEQEKKTADRPAADNKKITVAQIRTLKKEMLRTGVTEDAICERYNVFSVSQMNNFTYQRVMEALRKTKDAAA